MATTSHNTHRARGSIRLGPAGTFGDNVAVNLVDWAQSGFLLDVFDDTNLVSEVVFVGLACR